MSLFRWGIPIKGQNLRDVDINLVVEDLREKLENTLNSYEDMRITDGMKIYIVVLGNCKL